MLIFDIKKYTICMFYCICELYLYIQDSGCLSGRISWTPPSITDQVACLPQGCLSSPTIYIQTATAVFTTTLHWLVLPIVHGPSKGQLSISRLIVALLAEPCPRVSRVSLLSTRPCWWRFRPPLRPLIMHMVKKNCLGHGAAPLLLCIVPFMALWH